MGGVSGGVTSGVSSPMGTTSAQSLPRAGLLFCSRQPNAAGADSGKYILPDATGETPNPLAVAIRAATGWVSGTANTFYDAAGASVAVSSEQILVWSGINQYHILFSARGLDIYDPFTVSMATLAKAARWMHIIGYTLQWEPIFVDGELTTVDGELAFEGV